MIDAMRQALEALETVLEEDQPYFLKCGVAITALRQSIDQAKKQNPVAWMYQNSNTEHKYLVWEKQKGGRKWQPLYTAPPRKEWVELTREHREEFWASGVYNSDIDCVQDKLKELNK